MEPFSPQLKGEPWNDVLSREISQALGLPLMGTFFISKRSISVPPPGQIIKCRCPFCNHFKLLSFYVIKS